MVEKILRQMIAGTDGAPVYLVVNQIDGLALCIRPIIVVVSTGLFVGWRVRVCNNPNADILLNVQEALQASSLGHFQWQKINDIRASWVVGGVVPIAMSLIPVKEVSTVFTKLEIVSKLYSQVVQHFDVVHPIEDIRAFSLDVFKQELGKMQQHLQVIDADTTGQSIH